jgi:hypothetical protein
MFAVLTLAACFGDLKQVSGVDGGETPATPDRPPGGQGSDATTGKGGEGGGAMDAPSAPGGEVGFGGGGTGGSAVDAPLVNRDTIAADGPDSNPGCSSACSVGVSQCTAGMQRTCAVQASGCAEWGAPSACPSGQACSTAGDRCVCMDQCQNGAKRCADKNTVQRCAQMSGGCTGWELLATCSAPTTCMGSSSSAECVCVDECTQGARRCSASGVETCAKTNGCLRWGTPAAQACTAGARRCDKNGDAEECSNDGSGCLTWRSLKKCNSYVCDRGVCSDFECRPDYIKCNGECRPLLGACTVDTEHTLGALRACTYDTGVRRYTTSNDPAKVLAECRSMIQDLIGIKCAAQPDGWQASWVSFKPDGSPRRGSDMMFGSCNPIATQTDFWDTMIQDF